MLREAGPMNSTLAIQSAWDALQAGYARIILRGHESPSFAATFSPDGKKVATGSDDKTARVWNFSGNYGSAYIGRWIPTRRRQNHEAHH